MAGQEGRPALAARWLIVLLPVGLCLGLSWLASGRVEFSIWLFAWCAAFSLGAVTAIVGERPATRIAALTLAATIATFWTGLLIAESFYGALFIYAPAGAVGGLAAAALIEQIR